MTTLSTGRVLNHDPQSRAFEHPRRIVRPVSVLHRLDAWALDQGNLGACTGFAAAQWLNCRISTYNRVAYNRFQYVTGKNLYTNNYDGRTLYSYATWHDPFDWVWLDVDGGSSGLGVAKALKAIGAIQRYEWTFTFNGFLAALQAQPVLVGTAWPDSMFDPDRNGIIHVTGNLDGAGGHEYLANGINWSRKLIRIRNSWSGQWGIRGDAYISFDDMEKLLAAQGDCVVPKVATL